MNIVTQQLTEETIARRNEVAMLVASLTGVPVDDIMSKCRRQDIADARKLVMWTLAVMLGYTRNNVGILMERSHATVTYAVRCVNEGYCGKDVERLRQEIENIYKKKFGL
jgi:chromosomal replication initiation ATPase DnaA